MLLHQIVTQIVLFSFAAVSVQQAAVNLVPATQGLTEQTQAANEDVNKGDLVDMQVPKDLNSLVNFINQTTTLFKGTPATKNQQTEENIADAFSPFADAISTLMDNLISKKTYYRLGLEGNAIYTALKNLQPVFFNYGALVISVLATQSFQNAIGEDIKGAASKITEASNEYEPDKVNVPT
ncbi:MAG: hypothetical protein Q9195_007019 [Heterodermia aff. obscurata]